MTSLSNQLAHALSEAEVYVDRNGYASDDEGNRWHVGPRFPEGTYSASQVPMPHPGPARADNAKRIEAFARLPERQREGSFGRSILRQLRGGRVLSPKQKSAVRRMFHQSGLGGDADLFR